MTEVHKIDILRLRENGSFTFRVEVKAVQGESGHEVTLSRETYERLTNNKYASKRPLDSCSIANQKNRSF